MDVSTFISFLESHPLDYFSFRQVLNYVDFMNGARFVKFADSLKCRVLDKIGVYDPGHAEELGVLCQLLGESLTENGQKIITKRMLTIVNRDLFLKKEGSESESDSILTDNFLQNITQELISEPLLSCRISGKIDCQSESEQDYFSINKSSAKIYKSQEKYDILEKSIGFKENIKKDISENIESYNSSSFTKDSISAGGNGNIKKVIPNSIESFDSSFSLKGCVSDGRDGNKENKIPNSIKSHDISSTKVCISVSKNTIIKQEIPDSIENYCLSFSTKGSITGKNRNIIKEIPDSIEKCESSSYTKSCISAGRNGNIKKETLDNIEINDSHSIKDCISVGKNENMKKEIPNNIESFDLSSSTKSCINPSRVKDSTFGHFYLNDLMNYDVDLMPSDDLEDYTNTLKLRILDEISSIEPSDKKEELKVLCELLDSYPTDSDKKIICSRICALVDRTKILNKQHNDSTVSSYKQSKNSRKIIHKIPRYQQQAS